MSSSNSKSWRLYQGKGVKRSLKSEDLPPAPPWRQFSDAPQDVEQQQQLKGEKFQPPEEAIEMVNAALSLRRPLLITGNPGTGKSSLAYAVARELGLGLVLKWAITTRTCLKDGLYNYDAIARLQDAQYDDAIARLQDAQLADRGLESRKSIGEYITLGPLGTAFLPSDLPRVLLIDEIDKSDIDLPNDLLNLFEDGEFAIPELQRCEESDVTVRQFDRDEDCKQLTAKISNGVVRCRQFPFVIMTSNGERDFPPPFLRRCLRLKMPNPSPTELQEIVTSHFDEQAAQKAKTLIGKFCDRITKNREMLATDQLLNAIHMRTLENSRDDNSLENLEKRLLKDLNSPEEV
jgi:MoxR-like ATPase